MLFLQLDNLTSPFACLCSCSGESPSHRLGRLEVDLWLDVLLFAYVRYGRVLFSASVCLLLRPCPQDDRGAQRSKNKSAVSLIPSCPTRSTSTMEVPRTPEFADSFGGCALSPLLILSLIAPTHGEMRVRIWDDILMSLSLTPMKAIGGCTLDLYPLHTLCLPLQSTHTEQASLRSTSCFILLSRRLHGNHDRSSRCPPLRRQIVPPIANSGNRR